MKTKILITGLKDAVFVIGIVVLALWLHDRIYYDNPDLNKTIAALQSDNPGTIAQALVEANTLGMAKGHELIPDILLLLSDERRIPDEIALRIRQSIQSSPGPISGMEEQLKEIQTVGFTAAMTIQSMVIVNVSHIRRGSKKAKERIVSYVTGQIDSGNEYALTNGLLAVQQIRNKRLLPFWFQCLTIESEPIRIHALTGLKYYIHDRTHGFLSWKPEKEISPLMAKQLEHCLNDSSPYVKQQAQDIILELKEAGLLFQEQKMK